MRLSCDECLDSKVNMCDNFSPRDVIILPAFPLILLQSFLCLPLSNKSISIDLSLPYFLHYIFNEWEVVEKKKTQNAGKNECDCFSLSNIREIHRSTKKKKPNEIGMLSSSPPPFPYLYLHSPTQTVPILLSLHTEKISL